MDLFQKQTWWKVGIPIMSGSAINMSGLVRKYYDAEVSFYWNMKSDLSLYTNA